MTASIFLVSICGSSWILLCSSLVFCFNLQFLTSLLSFYLEVPKWPFPKLQPKPMIVQKIVRWLTPGVHTFWDPPTPPIWDL